MFCIVWTVLKMVSSPLGARGQVNSTKFLSQLILLNREAPLLESLKRVRRGPIFGVVLAMISFTWLVLDYKKIKYHALDFRRSAFGYSQSAADINYATDTLGYWRNEDGWWRGNCTVTFNENCHINQPWPHGKGRLTAQTFLQGLGAAVIREHGVALLWRLLVGPLLIALSVVYLAPTIAVVFWRWLAPR